jgi:biopolymer transport protein TolR
VNLPQVTTTALPGQSQELVVTITASRDIFINKYLVKLNELEPKMKEILSQRTDKDLYLRADQSVPYGFVVEVMAILRTAGAKGIGLVTEPERIQK